MQGATGSEQAGISLKLKTTHQSQCLVLVGCFLPWGFLAPVPDELAAASTAAHPHTVSSRYGLHKQTDAVKYLAGGDFSK
jgi:hypothetical protein